MAGKGIIHLDDRNFDMAVSSGVVLIDFWAPWCGPCRMQGTILEQLAAVTGDAVTIAKVNVDEAPRTAARFGIRSIPTLIILDHGRVVEQFVGVQQASTLLRVLQGVGVA